MNQLLVLFGYVSDPDCTKSFLGIPPWYKYLDVKVGHNCAPQLHQLNDVWLIGLAAIEILTRVATLVAVAFVIYGGIKYSLSRGNADKVTSAKSTLIDALTGLIIAVIATASITFIAGRFTQS
ncbi:MAG TPA: hypothetical protein VFW77_02375 [Candidatus Saccharimonadales bacterium]|nr:hypothetical protein [Candidatus Saccharimonadales bacterium]